MALINIDHLVVKVLWFYDKPTRQGWHERRMNTSIHSLYWVHSGKGTFITEAGSAEVSAGTLAYFSPGQTARMIADNDQPFHIYMLLFDCASLPYDGRQWGVHQAVPTLGLPAIQAFEPSIASELDAHFVHLNKRFTPYTVSVEIEAKYRLLTLLSLLLQTSDEVAGAMGGKSIFDKAKRHLDMFFHLDLKIHDLAGQLAVSQSYLRKLFLRHMGVTPKAYLNQNRNDHAIRLLLHTQAPVKEVASECGYNDELYFSTVFKQMNGVSPSLFRMNHTD